MFVVEEVDANKRNPSHDQFSKLMLVTVKMAQWLPPVIFTFYSSIILFTAFNTFVSGFNVETVEYKNISFTVWDVGGQVSLMI